MKKRFAYVGASVIALAIFVPAAAGTVPNNEPATYEFHLEVPNTAMAPNGDTVAITGMGMFGVHPKSVSGEGSFTHTLAGGETLTGTWTATKLLSFQPYGCGVVFGTPLPDNLCGGRLLMRVTLVPDADPSLSLQARLWIYCLIGAPPPSASEGVRLSVPGVINFNTVVGGENVYIKTS
jgi:hypothetical protein